MVSGRKWKGGEKDLDFAAQFQGAGCDVRSVRGVTKRFAADHRTRPGHVRDNQQRQEWKRHNVAAAQVFGRLGTASIKVASRKTRQGATSCATAYEHIRQRLRQPFPGLCRCGTRLHPSSSSQMVSATALAPGRLATVPSSLTQRRRRTKLSAHGYQDRWQQH